ncbi:MAG: hypothetical protein ACE5HS_20020, partial [bacterium]
QQSKSFKHLRLRRARNKANLDSENLDKLRRAFDAGDRSACERLLKFNPQLVDAASSDGQPYVLSALHREIHGYELSLE